MHAHMSWSKLGQIVKDKEARCAIVHGDAKSRTWLSKWTTHTHLTQPQWDHRCGEERRQLLPQTQTWKCPVRYNSPGDQGFPFPTVHPREDLRQQSCKPSSEGGGTHLCCLCRVLSLRALAGQLLIFYLSDCRLFLEVDRERRPSTRAPSNQGWPLRVEPEKWKVKNNWSFLHSIPTLASHQTTASLCSQRRLFPPSHGILVNHACLGVREKAWEGPRSVVHPSNQGCSETLSLSSQPQPWTPAVPQAAPPQSNTLYQHPRETHTPSQAYTLHHAALPGGFILICRCRSSFSEDSDIRLEAGKMKSYFL